MNADGQPTTHGGCLGQPVSYQRAALKVGVLGARKGLFDLVDARHRDRDVQSRVALSAAAVLKRRQLALQAVTEESHMLQRETLRIEVHAERRQRPPVGSELHSLRES